MVESLFQHVEHKLQETAVHLLVPAALKVESPVAQLDLNLRELQDLFSQLRRKDHWSFVQFEELVVQGKSVL